MSPRARPGCCAAGANASSAPMVKKLSKAMSGKTATNAGLSPEAFQDVFNVLLYHEPVEDARVMGLSVSPETEDK